MSGCMTCRYFRQCHEPILHWYTSPIVGHCEFRFPARDEQPAIDRNAAEHGCDLRREIGS